MLATKVFMMIATSLITQKKLGSIAGVGTNNIHLRNSPWFSALLFRAFGPFLVLFGFCRSLISLSIMLVQALEATSAALPRRWRQRLSHVIGQS